MDSRVFGDGYCARAVRRTAIVGALLCAAAGCTVTLIAKYDEVFDRSATALQRQMDAYLTGLEAAAPNSEEATYAHHQGFYSDYAVDVRALLIRARSLPKNALAARQVELMLRSVEDLRSTHEAQGRLSPGYVAQARDLLNQSWQNILALELAKKR